MAQPKIEEIMQLRRAVLEYGRQFWKETKRKGPDVPPMEFSQELWHAPLEEMLKFVSGKTGRDVTRRDLEGICFSSYYKPNLGLDDQRFQIGIVKQVAEEQNSVRLIERVVDQSIEDLAPSGRLETEVLVNALYSIVRMPDKKYNEIYQEAMSRDPQLCGRYSSHFTKYRYSDVEMILSLLKSADCTLNIEDIRHRLLQKEHNDELGYLGHAFRENFDIDTTRKEERYPSVAESPSALFKEYLDKKGRYVKKAEAHRKFAEMVEEKGHELSSPFRRRQPHLVHVMDIDIEPHAREFLGADRILVLGKSKGFAERDLSWDEQQRRGRPQLYLAVYNIRENALEKMVNASIDLPDNRMWNFDPSLDASLSVGSDGTIYVNGGERRFTRSLDKIEYRTGDYAAALAHIVKALGKDPDRFKPHIHHVIEKDGDFYFTINEIMGQDGFDLNRGVLIAANKDGIIGSALRYMTVFSAQAASGGMGGLVPSHEWDPKPKIVVTDRHIYFKSFINGKDEREQPKHATTVYCADRNMSRESIENMFPLIGLDELSMECVCSNVCMGNADTLYVVTRMPDEVCQSIKAYVIDHESRKAVLAAVTYPEEPHGGYASKRRIAIFGNIMAYTQFTNRAIHFYELDNYSQSPAEWNRMIRRESFQVVP